MSLLFSRLFFFWKLCMHLVLLIIIYFKLSFKKLISRNNLFSVYFTKWCQKWEEGSKSQSFEPPHKILCFLLKLGELEPLTLPATVAVHGYLMRCAGYIVFLPLLFLLLFLFSNINQFPTK